MFSDELLKYYSWKGQKNKKPFSEFKICKVIIGRYLFIFSLNYTIVIKPIIYCTEYCLNIWYFIY